MSYWPRYGQTGSTHTLTVAETPKARLTGLRSVKNPKGGMIRPTATAEPRVIGFHIPRP